MIFPGQSLEIPDSATAADPAPIREPTAPYVVRPGDTLSEIAFRYGVSIDDLQLLNELPDPHLIAVGQTLVVPAMVEVADAREAPVVERPSRPQLESIIDDPASEEHVDPGLIKAISWVESRWDQGALSSAGAVGVMQLQPATTNWLETEVFGHELNESESIYDNVKGGIRLYRILLDETGNEELAIMAYYQGLTPTLEGCVYDETRRYLDAVRVVRQTFWPQ